MKVYDYECMLCGEITEHYVKSPTPNYFPCPVCKGHAKKIISMRMTEPIDCSWLKSVTEVVNKSSKDPHCTEFLKSPTRQNYKNWMKGEGLRHVEDGEKSSYLTKPDRESKLKVMKHKMQLKYRERNALTVK